MQWFWRGVLDNIIVTFCYLGIVFPEKRVQLSILKKHDLPSPKSIYVMFGWNWPNGSGRKDLSDINVLLVLYCLERVMVLVFKLTCITFNQEYSFLSFVEFCFIALEEKIVAWHHCIFAVSSVSTLRKGPGSVFELTWFVFHKDKLCCVFFFSMVQLF